MAIGKVLRHMAGNVLVTPCHDDVVERLLLQRGVEVP